MRRLLPLQISDAAAVFAIILIFCLFAQAVLKIWVFVVSFKKAGAFAPMVNIEQSPGQVDFLPTAVFLRENTIHFPGR